LAAGAGGEQTEGGVGKSDVDAFARKGGVGAELFLFAQPPGEGGQPDGGFVVEDLGQDEGKEDDGEPLHPDERGLAGLANGFGTAPGVDEEVVEGNGALVDEEDDGQREERDGADVPEAVEVGLRERPARADEAEGFEHRAGHRPDEPMPRLPAPEKKRGGDEERRRVHEAMLLTLSTGKSHGHIRARAASMWPASST